MNVHEVKTPGNSAQQDRFSFIAFEKFDTQNYDFCCWLKVIILFLHLGYLVIL